MDEATGINLQCIADQEIHHINAGEYTIGRGWLNCTDKKISRNHGKMKVYNDNSILLTSIHQNPLFYRLNDSNFMQVLNKDCDIALNIGDTFGLLPELYWFKILQKTDDRSETPDLDLESFDNPNQPDVPAAEHHNYQANDSVANGENAKKRKLPDWMSPENKKHRSNDLNQNASCSADALREPSATNPSMNARSNGGDPQQNENAVGDQTEPVSVVNTGIPLPSDVLLPVQEVQSSDGVNEETVQTIAPSNDATNTNEEAAQGATPVERAALYPNAEATAGVKVKEEPADEGDTAASTSTGITNVAVKKEEESSGSQTSHTPGTPLRESCTFGIRCYRRNAEHRTEQAHPGDLDYRRPQYADAPPGAQPCPYGVHCYRRNPDHFRQFAHPPATDKKQPPKAKNEGGGTAKRPKREAKQAGTQAFADNQLDDDDFEDDEEDPFGTDDSDQEYNPDNDSVSGGEDDVPDEGVASDATEPDPAEDSA